MDALIAIVVATREDFGLCVMLVTDGSFSIFSISWWPFLKLTNLRVDTTGGER